MQESAHSKLFSKCMILVTKIYNNIGNERLVRNIRFKINNFKSHDFNYKFKRFAIIRYLPEIITAKRIWQFKY